MTRPYESIQNKVNLCSNEHRFSSLLLPILYYWLPIHLIILLCSNPATDILTEQDEHKHNKVIETKNFIDSS